MNRFKYQRTPHLPMSPGVSNDDISLDTSAQFEDKEVVVTEKMDGENTSLYRDHYHARSLDSRHHPSRSAVKALWGSVRYLIPEGWRIVGENVYATHSIHYTDLEGYFCGFSVWNQFNECLSWEETLAFLDVLNIPHAPQFYQGPYVGMDDILDTYARYKKEREDQGHEVEGFVMRNIDRFHYDDFGNNIAKYVRKGHVQTDEHWMHKEIVPNKLKARTIIKRKTGDKNGSK